MGALLHIRPPYHRAHQMAPGRWAVVHSVPGTGGAGAPPLLAVDVDGFAHLSVCEHAADWMNIEREQAQQRAADEARLCGLRWEAQA